MLLSKSHNTDRLQTLSPLSYNKLKKNRMKFRKATECDLPQIVEMIADDELGQTRENFQIPLPPEYLIE